MDPGSLGASLVPRGVPAGLFGWLLGRLWVAWYGLVDLLGSLLTSLGAPLVILGCLSSALCIFLMLLGLDFPWASSKRSLVFSLFFLISVFIHICIGLLSGYGGKPTVGYLSASWVVPYGARVLHKPLVRLAWLSLMPLPFLGCSRSLVYRSFCCPIFYSPCLSSLLLVFLLPSPPLLSCVVLS